VNGGPFGYNAFVSSTSQEYLPPSAEAQLRFDRIVSQVEAVLLPKLEELRTCAGGDHRFDEVTTFSRRHADIVHAVGLSCHPFRTATIEETYSLCVQITHWKRFCIRGFVAWHQTYSRNRLRGYMIYEATIPDSASGPDDNLEGFTMHLPALCKGFERGLRRGLPPRTKLLWSFLRYGNATRAYQFCKTR
jgi:hypothetical protein